MENYYAKHLNANKLFQVYDTRIPRIRQYLESEIAFAKSHIKHDDAVLEVGCGYGRILAALAPFAGSLTGLDISEDSIALGKKYLETIHTARLLVMDANAMDLSGAFDVVLCLQNGLSSMRVDPGAFIRKTTELLEPEGKALYSTYSPLFWEHRLAWFEEQAGKKLLGPIDYERTKDGVIVCEDGFTAKTFSEDALHELGKTSGYPYTVTTVDESSVFLIISK